MQQRTKQRLTGGCAVLVISIAFLPLLFHQTFPGIRKTSALQQKPEIPYMKTVVYELPLKKPVHDVENKPAVVPATPTPTPTPTPAPAPATVAATVMPPAPFVSSDVPATHAAVKRTADIPAIAADIPDAWVLQLASFSDADNAKRLVEQLRAQHLPVYTKTQHNGATITRVFVGPYIDKTKIHALQQHLEQQMRLNSVIRKYHS